MPADATSEATSEAAPAARAEPPFEPVAAARAAIRAASAASLATLGGDGGPFVSLVAFAPLADLSPVLWLSDLAAHSRNLARDPRAALLFVAPGGEGGDPLAGARVTLSGALQPTDDAAARRRFAAFNGTASMPPFADFRAYRMDLSSAHLVAGFGRIVTLGRELLLDLDGCEDLGAGEAMIVEHMNDDHGDAIDLYARVLLGLPAADWRLAGCDAEGVDLVSGKTRARLPFPSRATTVAEAGGHLKQFARAARERLDAMRN